MSGRFANKVALVTGGASGMGASHVQGFAAEGARVVIADVNAKAGEDLAQTIGEASLFVRLDVTDANSWRETLSVVEQQFGPIDILVNNAAVLQFGSIDTADIDAFKRVVEVNLYGGFLGMRFVLPGMRMRNVGCVINIISAAGLIPYQDSAAYVAAKWGLRGLSRSAALDLAGTGVRINAVFPGPTRTPMMGDFTDEYAKSLVQQQAITRWGTSQEVTNMVLFLASDEAAYCTGGEYAVDGGASLGPAHLKPEESRL